MHNTQFRADGKLSSPTGSESLFVILKLSGKHYITTIIMWLNLRKLHSTPAESANRNGAAIISILIPTSVLSWTSCINRSSWRWPSSSSRVFFLSSSWTLRYEISDMSHLTLQWRNRFWRPVREQEIIRDIRWWSCAFAVLFLKKNRKQ
jgi:hypothetical protein